MASVPTSVSSNLICHLHSLKYTINSYSIFVNVPVTSDGNPVPTPQAATLGHRVIAIELLDVRGYQYAPFSVMTSSLLLRS